jgi:hypothetical protein
MIDDFGQQPGEPPFDPLSVVLFKALQVVAFVFVIAFLAIAQQKQDGKVDSKAEFFISMTWPDDHPEISISSSRIRSAMLSDTAAATSVSCHWSVTIAAAPTTSCWSAARKSSPPRQELVSIRGIVADSFFTSTLTLHLPGVTDFWRR